MISINNVKGLFEEHGGIMQTSELLQAKIQYRDLQKLMEDGYIEKVRYGYYQWIFEKDTSEINILLKLFPDGILCMNTALFYYRYSDRAPLRWDIAVSKDSSKSRFKIDYPFVKPYYMEPALLNIGLTSGVIDGYTVQIYDKERLICDCLRSIKKMDKEIFNKAIQAYVQDSTKNIPKLMEYAKKLKIEQKTKDLLGVWL